MITHFICRGNSFRSIIAEAYLNSLEIKDSRVLSSGTTAASDKARNLVSYRITLDLLEKHGIREFAKAGYGDQLTQSRMEKADITVCMNQRVYDGCLRCVTFPASPRIWAVADIGEPGRISNAESDRKFYREEAYQEIVKNVDRLISESKPIPTLVAYKTGTLSHRQIRATVIYEARSWQRSPDSVRHSVATLATSPGGYLGAGYGPGLLEEVIQPLALPRWREGVSGLRPLGNLQ